MLSSIIRKISFAEVHSQIQVFSKLPQIRLNTVGSIFAAKAFRSNDLISLK